MRKSEREDQQSVCGGQGVVRLEDQAERLERPVSSKVRKCAA